MIGLLGCLNFTCVRRPLVSFIDPKSLALFQQVYEQGQAEKEHHADRLVEIKKKKMLYNQKF